MIGAEARNERLESTSDVTLPKTAKIRTATERRRNVDAIRRRSAAMILPKAKTKRREVS